MKRLLNGILASSLVLSMTAVSFAMESNQFQKDTEVYTETLSTYHPMYAKYNLKLNEYRQKHTTSASTNSYFYLFSAYLADFTGNGLEELVVFYWSHELGNKMDIWSYDGSDVFLVQDVTLYTFMTGTEDYYVSTTDWGTAMVVGDCYSEAYMSIEQAYCFYYINQQGQWVQEVYQSQRSEDGNITSYVLNYNESSKTVFDNAKALAEKHITSGFEWFSGTNELVENKYLSQFTEDPSYPSWASNFINFVSLKIMPDISTSNYDDVSSRGLIAQSIYNMCGNGETVTATKNFNDLGSFSKAIAWCDVHGIMNGESDEFFGTNKEVTREQFALILQKTADAQGKTGKSADITVLNSFFDSSSISSWAMDGMAWSVSNGLMSGSENKLNPSGNITRTEVAVMLYNFDKL